MQLEIRKITPQDDPQIRDIIQSVGLEYGAVGEGYGPSDEEVSAISQHYIQRTNSCYFIAWQDEQIVGGCGIAAFSGSTHMCELKKLFLLPKSRRLGIGRALTETCLDYAIQQGYQQCYLDTLSNMHRAIALYKTLGFQSLAAPLPDSEHTACDVWMLKTL